MSGGLLRGACVDFCLACGPADPAFFTDACVRLESLLAEENAKHNLTRIGSGDDFWNKHVADSISLAGHLPRLGTESLSLADIGCGAGFPSIILAAAFPRLSVTAIDSTGKKIGFVDLAARTLGLANLRAVKGRMCELSRLAEFKNAFDIITARAVGPAAEIFRESAASLRHGGMFALYKTPGEADTELDAVGKASAKQGFKWRKTEEFQLPGGERRLFIFGGRGGR